MLESAWPYWEKRLRTRPGCVRDTSVPSNHRVERVDAPAAVSPCRSQGRGVVAKCKTKDGDAQDTEIAVPQALQQAVIRIMFEDHPDPSPPFSYPFCGTPKKLGFWPTDLTKKTGADFGDIYRPGTPPWARSGRLWARSGHCPKSPVIPHVPICSSCFRSSPVASVVLLHPSEGGRQKRQRRHGCVPAHAMLPHPASFRPEMPKHGAGGAREKVRTIASGNCDFPTDATDRGFGYSIRARRRELRAEEAELRAAEHSASGGASRHRRAREGGPRKGKWEMAHPNHETGVTAATCILFAVCRRSVPNGITHIISVSFDISDGLADEGM
eukprot:gene16101-biopygen717